MATSRTMAQVLVFDRMQFGEALLRLIQPSLLESEFSELRAFVFKR